KNGDWNPYLSNASLLHLFLDFLDVNVSSLDALRLPSRTTRTNRIYRVINVLIVNLSRIILQKRGSLKKSANLSYHLHIDGQTILLKPLIFSVMIKIEE